MMANDKPYRILLVEPEPDVLELLVASLSRRFNAHITCVATAQACLDIELITPHHLVIADVSLEDGDGFQLADHLLALSRRPVILMASKPSADQAIDALRLGVKDLLCKPFPVAQLLESCERALRGQEIHRQHVVKFARMRDMVRRVIRERRGLNQRIELLCKDLVGAHRRLAQKVVEIAEANLDATS